MPAPSSLHDRGLALFEQLHGGHAGDAMVAEMRHLSRFCRDDHRLGLWRRHGPPRVSILVTRQLVLVASCVTLGNAMPQLRAHAQAALQSGATRQQVIETILQLTFYAGGPAVRNSLVELKDVLAEPAHL